MKKLQEMISFFTLLSCLRCMVWSAASPSAATRQRKSIISDRSIGLHRRNIIISDENGQDDTDHSRINRITEDDIIDSSRELQNMITSNHILHIEFSGVTYASMSLDVVKKHLLEVVEDVVTTHLGSEIEVVDVQKGDCSPACRKLRGSPQRRLSFIRLVVSISVRHSPSISSGAAFDVLSEILSEYVDNDFQRYMRSLPGNGDYVGDVDVVGYHNTISINLPLGQTEPDVSIDPPSANEPDTQVSLRSTRNPTWAPTKGLTPANDWLNVGTDTLEVDIPWWSWVIAGSGVALIALCLCWCFCTLQSRRKRAPKTVEEILQVRGDTDEPAMSMNRRASFNDPTRSMNRIASFDDPAKSMNRKAYFRDPARSDIILYEPNENENFPQPPKKKRRKKSSKRREMK